MIVSTNVLRRKCIMRNIPAIYEMAYSYDNGYRTRRSKAHAVELYAVAAWYGHADAQYNLALSFMHGEGIPEGSTTCY